MNTIDNATLSDFNCRSSKGKGLSMARKVFCQSLAQSTHMFGLPHGLLAIPIAVVGIMASGCQGSSDGNQVAGYTAPGGSVRQSSRVNVSRIASDTMTNTGGSSALGNQVAGYTGAGASVRQSSSIGYTKTGNVRIAPKVGVLNVNNEGANEDGAGVEANDNSAVQTNSPGENVVNDGNGDVIVQGADAANNAAIGTNAVGSEVIDTGALGDGVVDGGAVGAAVAGSGSDSIADLVWLLFGA